MIQIIGAVAMILLIPIAVTYGIAIIRGYKEINKWLDRIEESLEERENLIESL